MKRLAFVLMIVLVAALAACGSAAPTPMPKTQLSLTATDIAYDTNRLEAKVGQPVVVTLHNEGVLEHDFSIMNMPVTGEVIAEEGESEMDHDTAGVK